LALTDAGEAAVVTVVVGVADGVEVAEALGVGLGLGAAIPTKESVNEDP
jgi:hypothetical protein